MRNKKFYLVLALIMVSYLGWSQCTDYKWPADMASAEKRVDAIKAAIKDQNYKSAIGSINWMLNTAPQWHSDLYVYGVDVYDKLAGQELDPSQKQVYIDSLMIIYDLRIKSCGDEANVLNRKAISAYKYNAQNKDKVADVLAIFDKTYEVSGNNVFDNNLDSYMATIKYNVDLLKNLNEDQIMQRYNKLMDVIDAKVKKAQEQNKTNDIEKYKKVVNAIDAKLTKVVKMNCAFVKKNLVAKFQANSSDVALAKKIYSGMLTECSSEAVWLQAAELLYKTNPDFSVTKELASAYIQTKSFDKATPLITDLQTKAKTPGEKAWIDILNGDVELQKGNKPSARDLYKKALVTDAASKEAYQHLGDLYSASAGECSKTPGSAEEKLVYIAAYQQYFKAANVEKCQETLTKYPTLAELQKANLKQGEQKKLACWIDETVTVKARKE